MGAGESVGLGPTPSVGEGVLDGWLVLLSPSGHDKRLILGVWKTGITAGVMFTEERNRQKTGGRYTG